MMSDVTNLSKKPRSSPPSLFESTAARIISTAVSVRMVPPTVTATA